jgi:hypothetical protein
MISISGSVQQDNSSSWPGARTSCAIIPHRIVGAERPADAVRKSSVTSHLGPIASLAAHSLVKKLMRVDCERFVWCGHSLAVRDGATADNEVGE